MCYIGRELILRGAVHLLVAADKNNGKADFRQTADDLVNP